MTWPGRKKSGHNKVVKKHGHPLSIIRIYVAGHGENVTLLLSGLKIMSTFPQMKNNTYYTMS